MSITTDKGHFMIPETLKVERFLHESGLVGRIIVVEEEIFTAQQTAKALGVTTSEIAKSLVVLVDGRPLVLVLPGNKRVNFERLKAILGAAEARLADPETVIQATGFDVRGVSPVAHAQPLQVLIDRELAKRDVLYAAAGSHHAVFRVTYSELHTLTGGASIDL